METSFRLLCGFRSSTSWIHFTFICSMLCMWTCVESWSYFYSNSTMNWEDARGWCREHYTDMVAIQNQEEIEHLKSSLPRQRYYYWIGIRKINNTWTWVGTSKALTEEATNWATGEPNNGITEGASGNSEDCVEMYIKREKEEGKWNDERCSKHKTALCYAATCKTDSCFHGECVETINSHKCDCFEGFYGDKCGEVVKCNKDEVTVPDQGHVYCTHKYGNFLYDSLCQYSCEEGYNLSMSRPLRCNASGKWSDVPPTCESKECPAPETPTNAQIRCRSSPGTSHPLGTVCSFSCDEGYELQGALSIECTNSGQWTSTPPTCTVKRCPLLEAPENGHINCSDSSVYNSKCSFTCDPNYSLEGHELLICDHHGNWTGEKPTCKASSPVTAVATSVATGGTLLSGLSVAAYILKKLKNKATKFGLNSNSDIGPPSHTYKNSTDSLI